MVKFSKVREVGSPVRGTSRSAGIDLKCPTIDMKFINDMIALNHNEKVQTTWSNDYRANLDGSLTFVLHPKEYVLIPSGIRVEIPFNKVLVAYNKGGVGGAKGVDHLAEIIDADYMGELFISIINHNDKPFEISSGQKLIQLKLEEAEYSEWTELSDSDIHTVKTDRGVDKLGSTGTH